MTTTLAATDAPIEQPFGPLRPMPLEHLEARICQGAANLTAAEGVWLQDVAEFDRRRGWAAWGMVSCAAWLAWHVGIDSRAAREKVRVAHALVEFPLFAQAVISGRLTYSKARAITRIANQFNAPELLDLAVASTSHQLERFVAAFRRADAQVADADQRAFDARSVYISTTDAVTEIVVRMPVEMGRALIAAIGQFTVDEPGVALSARRADALIGLAEHAVATLGHAHTDEPRYLATVHLSPDSFGPEPGAFSPDSGDAGTPCRCDRQSRREDLLASLGAGSGGSRGCCVGEGDGVADLLANVPLHSARRMLCEAAIEALLVGPDGNPMRLGRLSRVARRRLKRALLLRDGGCRVPGCTHRGWLDAHHLVHWLEGGDTDVDNLVLLCRFHHRWVHEDSWTIVGNPGGQLSFHSPDGRVLPAFPPVAVGDATVITHSPAVDDGRSRWAGDSMNLGYVVGVVLDQQNHRASREASHA